MRTDRDLLDMSRRIVDVVRMSDSATNDDTSLESHFEFGANWRRFLSLVDESRVTHAELSLRRFLSLDDDPSPLAGQSFLDAGCGSGLFSLAASRLGATVVSFDLDPESVACTRELRSRFPSNRSSADRDDWRIVELSVLDADALRELGQFDVVYSWGVLHHTGAMWDAIANAADRVADDGTLFIAIYNDQGDLSTIWRGIKKLYVTLPRLLRTPYALAVGGSYYSARVAMAAARRIGRTVIGVPALASPIDRSSDAAFGKHYGDRGMSRWYDLVDWVGGYPFEVATPDDIVRFLGDRGFALKKLRSVGGKLGCNEFVLRKLR